MLKFDPYGIFCEPAGVYIDPWKRVDKAIITHAHSDHAKWGNKHYLAHIDSIPVLKYRLGEISTQGVAYDEVIYMNGVKISLHPAGHIVGSAQIRLEYNGEIWVVSGDYKLKSDGVSQPFDFLKCDHFVTESTFGLPIYNFPESIDVHTDINGWWRNNKHEGKNSVIIGYALGKSQRIIKHLDSTIGDIYAHGAVANLNDILQINRKKFPLVKRIDKLSTKKTFQGAIIVAPPSAIGSPWLKRFEPFSLGICSGWMQLRGPRRRRGADRGFILSDHADWNQLNTAVKATGAENIYVTHGYKTVYAKWLRSEYKLNAIEVDAMYEGESLEGEDLVEESKEIETNDNKKDEKIF